MKVNRLETEFIGKGEVKGFEFREVYSDGDYRIYQVLSNTTHYEVFKVKITPLCIDFDNRVYSETEFKEVYPKSKDFGVNSWTARTFEKAMGRIEKLKQNGTN